MKTRERASETPTTGLSVASSVRMVLARLIALFDLRRLSIPRNGKFVLSGLNRSKPEIIFPGKSAWFSGLVKKKLKILKWSFMGSPALYKLVRLVPSIVRTSSYVVATVPDPY